MPGPLEGLRVVDCSRGMAGTRLTGVLADLGADVVWVEPPGGDPWREALGVAYSVYNRGKRSVVLDLKQEDDRASLDGLLATADVFVRTWSPGVAERLGLGPEQLRAQFPGLVLASIDGFGPGLEESGLPGYEALVAAYSGAMNSQPAHAAGPTFLGLPKASLGAAYLAATGVLAALHARESSGLGHHVETSLYDGIIAYLRMYWGRTSAQPGGYELMATRRMVSRSYRCADDEYLGLSTMSRGGFDRFVAALGLTDRIPIDHPDAPLTREQADIVVDEIPTLFEGEPREVWLARLIEADLAVMSYLRPGEIFDERPITHLALSVRIDDPTFGVLEQAASPAKFSLTPTADPAPAPRVGQHTAEVLAEIGTRVPVERAVPAGAGTGRLLLSGLKVLDFGHWYASPYACRLLADLGADVITVEPLAGDPMRPYERAFAGANGGKRSVALDLKSEEGRRRAEQLVRWADVVTHNLRIGVATSFGLTADAVRALNPDAIHLQCSGWGPDGADAGRQSLAPMMSAYVGQAYEAGGRHMPPIPPMAHEDSTAGLIGAYAVLAALRYRDRTGVAQSIDLSMVGSALYDISHVVRRADGTVLGSVGLDSLQRGTGALNRLYETSDGAVLVVAGRDRQIRGLGEVVGHDILGDARFTTPAARAEDDYALERIVGDALLALDTATAVATLRAHGVPAVVPAEGNPVELLEHPVNRRLGRTQESEVEGQGTVHDYGTLLRVDGEPPLGVRRYPMLDEHGSEVPGSAADTHAAVG